MLANILSVSGHAVGFTSTDGITIRNEVVSEKDSSGYAGAARVLNDPSIDAAVLELARGDLLNSGLYIDRCDVAALLNIGREQIGIDGIDTLEQMANLKRQVIDAARKAVVLNADDKRCRRLIGDFPVERTIIFSFNPQSKPVKEHLQRGGVAFCLDESSEPRIVRLQGRETRPIISIAELPSAWGGVVRHNIANAMAAAALADGLGLSSESIRAGLRAFELTVEQSQGRFTIIQERPFLLIVDHALSPPAAEALATSLIRVDVQGERMCMLTTVGNRPAWHYRELVAHLAKCFEHFICFEQKHYRRGRAPGEISALLRSELLRQGIDAQSIEIAPDHESALRILAARAKPGDLVVVLGRLHRKEFATTRWSSIIRCMTLLCRWCVPRLATMTFPFLRSR
jgi:cyanophycin synthetase